MQYVTNGKFAVLLIPECKQYSINEMGKTNGFEVKDVYDPALDYILPYRNPYDRIIRAVAADLHEVMLDAGFVDLNRTKWETVKDRCLEYIVNWIDTEGHLPVKKQNSHSSYIRSYLSPEIERYKIINVDNINILPKYIKETYGTDIGIIPRTARLLLRIHSSILGN